MSACSDPWVSRWDGTFYLITSVCKTVHAAPWAVSLLRELQPIWLCLVVVATGCCFNSFPHMKQRVPWPAVPAVCLMSVLLQNPSGNLLFEASKHKPSSCPKTWILQEEDTCVSSGAYCSHIVCSHVCGVFCSHPSSTSGGFLSLSPTVEALCSLVSHHQQLLSYCLPFPSALLQTFSPHLCWRQQIPPSVAITTSQTVLLSKSCFLT